MAGDPFPESNHVTNYEFSAFQQPSGNLQTIQKGQKVDQVFGWDLSRPNNYGSKKYGE
jgi:hypothetical protein